MRIPNFLLLAAILVGCSRADQPPFPDQPWRQTGDVIDSLVPMEELLARFRRSTIPVDTLAGGTGSIDSLAESIFAAVAQRDSIALAGLRVSTSEFAWLLAGNHVYTRTPYDLDPALLWLQISAGSDKGQRRLLERLGGKPLSLISTICRTDTLQFTGNAVKAWSDCQVRWQDGPAESTGRLFGTVVERDGRFKVLGYGNDY